jgi:hypothetical protein
MYFGLWENTSTCLSFIFSVVTREVIAFGAQAGDAARVRSLNCAWLRSQKLETLYLLHHRAFSCLSCCEPFSARIQVNCSRCPDQTLAEIKDQEYRCLEGQLQTPSRRFLRRHTTRLTVACLMTTLQQVEHRLIFHDNHRLHRQLTASLPPPHSALYQGREHGKMSARSGSRWLERD